MKRIYEEGIATGIATFETEAPAWQSWSASHLNFGRLVAEGDGNMLGWAALSKVSDRCVYAGVAEVSVYIAEAVRGRGIGKQLLLSLIEKSERHEIWTLNAGIFPANKISVHLHEQCGFRLVGRRERIGKLNGQWHDTLLFERRSTKTGLN